MLSVRNSIGIVSNKSPFYKIEKYIKIVCSTLLKVEKKINGFTQK